MKTTLIHLFIFVKVIMVHHLANGRSLFGEPNNDGIIDLGYSLNSDTVNYPGSKPFILSKDKQGVDEKSGVWYASFSMSTGEHLGTHVDAPFHFFQGGWTVDEIPLSRLYNVPAVLIDLSSNEKFNQSSLITVEDFITHEIIHGPIPQQVIILIRTGWSRHWPKREAYLGINGDSLSFPGLDVDAMKWLVHGKDPIAIGIDTASIDPGSSKKYPAHALGAKNQIYNIENVANLHLLAAERERKNCDEILLTVMPMKVTDATGAPARVIARCNKE